MAADRRPDLDTRACPVARERQAERAEERWKISLLHAHIGPVTATRRDVVSGMVEARIRDVQRAAVRVVGVVVVVRVLGVDDDVDVGLVRDLRVVERPRQGSARVVGRLRIGGVLPGRVGDLLCGCVPQRRIAALNARLPVLRILDAGRERTRVGPDLQLALVGVPVADVDDEGREQQKDRNHDRGHHENGAAFATHIEAPQKNAHAVASPCPPRNQSPSWTCPPRTYAPPSVTQPPAREANASCFPSSKLGTPKGSSSALDRGKTAMHAQFPALDAHGAAG